MKIEKYLEITRVTRTWYMVFPKWLDGMFLLLSVSSREPIVHNINFWKIGFIWYAL